MLIFISLVFLSCQQEEGTHSIQKVDWNSKKSKIHNFNDYQKGKTYLPLYSHIYHIHEARAFDLTITISMRNLSQKDSVYILNADYYNEEGKIIRKYLKTPIYLKPMETLEIILEEQDLKEGYGASFLFDWAVANAKNTPLFEGVMSSTSGQEGLSFTTRGVMVSE